MVGGSVRTRLSCCILAIAVVAGSGAASAAEPGSRLPLSLEPHPPPTDADLARAEAAGQPGRRTSADDIANTLGVNNGREEVFRIRSDDLAPSDAGWNGFIDGDGAKIQYRW